MYEQAKKIVFDSRRTRQQFAIALKNGNPVNVSKLNLPKQLIINKLSWFKNFSTVSLRKFPYKIHPIDIFCKSLTYYKNRFYLFNDPSQVDHFDQYRDIYLENDRFREANAGRFKTDLQPRRLSTFECNQCQAADLVKNQGYCPVALMDDFKLCKGLPYLMASYKGAVHSFSSAQSLLHFLKTPQMFENAKLPTKMPSPDLRPIYKEKANKGNDCTDYLDLHLGEIMMKILSQIGDERIKYPTINSQETALKFIAISLKANNPNQNDFYRKKYRKKLKQFLIDCELNQAFLDINKKRAMQKIAKKWNPVDEESYL